MKSSAWIACLLSVWSLAGCKDDIDAQQFVDGYATNVCEAVIACDCDYPNGARLDHCLAQLEVSGESQAELNSVDGLKFDGACAQKAIDQIGEIGCSVPVVDPDADCKAPCKVWFGPESRGATCTSINGYDNCKQGLVCDGVCVDPCDEPDLPKVGEACAPQYGCVEEAFCDSMTAPLFPTCRALPGEGSPCALTDFGPQCGRNLFCDFMDDVCIALPGAGDPCPDGVCGEDLFCDVEEAMPACAPLPGLGDACDISGVCAAPNQCDGMVCIAPRPQVCGAYGGVPEDGGSASDPSGDPSTDPTLDESGDPTFDTGIDTDIDTGAQDTGALGDCCAPQDVAGCNDVEIMTCVCTELTACCSDLWDASCADAVSSLGCGVC